MPVTARAEYACLAMLELACRYADEKPVRLVDITDKHGISHPFLVQILGQMKAAGLVNTTRGKAGGYRLARPPEEITLADIVEPLDSLAKSDDRPDGSGLARTLQVVWGGLAKNMAEARTGYLTRFRLSELVPGNGQTDYVI